MLDLLGKCPLRYKRLYNFGGNIVYNILYVNIKEGYSVFFLISTFRNSEEIIPCHR